MSQHKNFGGEGGIRTPDKLGFRAIQIRSKKNNILRAESPARIRTYLISVPLVEKAA